MSRDISGFSEIIDKLKITLNLNQYEAKVILALILSPHPQTAKEISQRSTVPIQRVYDILEELKRKGLVVQTIKFPKTYTVKNLESLLKKRFIEERMWLNKWAHEEIKRIEEEKRKRLNHLKRESFALLEVMKTLHRRPKTEPTKIAVQIEGWDNIQELLIELLKEADYSFWGVSRPPDWRDLTTLGIIQPRSLSEWYEAIDVKGVDVRWLTSLSAIPSYIGYTRATYLPRRFIEDDKISEKYVIVDGSKVLVNLRDPETGIHSATAILIESVSIARIFEQHFETLWREAKPTETVVLGFEEIVETVCSKLREYAFTDLEIRVYRSLLRTGASSVKDIRVDLKWADKKDTPSLKALRKALNGLKRRGVIEKHPTLDLYLPSNPKTLLQTIYR
jgi:sugar-specific transcriptional regulator TrmB